ncbi:MAG TPA: peptidoglycan DD-metalloendopeptidase family protein [Longimicrobiales bacterium]|nr:peptidoglycan DD-metalloendopeptidase family protein [Longimicrobiales bacterium]
MPNRYRIVVVFVIAVFSIGAFAAIEPRVADVDPDRAPELGVLYAAPAERVETRQLAAGETLTGVLAQSRVTGAELAELLQGLREHLNPRRLAAGAEITVRRWNASDSMRAVEVRLNADTTVRLQRADSGWSSDIVVTPTVFDTVHAAGTIEAGRTLYESIVLDQQSLVPPADRTDLVMSLADIYEYKLDFTREIQPGDSYRFVYEREARPDGSARSRRILAAEVVSKDRPFTAVWFNGVEGGSAYYDAQGRSMRQGFSRYPVDFRRITSRFNPNRYHPVLGIYRAHLGTDFGVPTGTPVKATGDGTVVFAGRDGGYGNVIVLRHHGGYTTRYAHLSRFAPGIRVGRKVALKELIGYSGATGLATGPHLHYELRLNGRAIDGQTAKLPGAPPLPAKLKMAFDSQAQVRLEILERGARPRYAARPTSPSPAPETDPT